MRLQCHDVARFVLALLAGGVTSLGLGMDAGLLDGAWGTGGVAGMSGQVTATVETADGGMYVAGSIGGAHLSATIVARTVTLTKLTPAGMPDTTFAPGGRPAGTASLPYGPTPLPLLPRSLVVQADGKVLVLCESQYGELVVYRVTTEGVVDPGFNFLGRPFLRISIGSQPMAVAIALAPGGGFVVLGTYRTSVVGAYPYSKLCKFTAAGEVEAGFGTGGSVVIAGTPPLPGYTPPPRQALSLEVREDGGYRILSSIAYTYSAGLAVDVVSPAEVLGTTKEFLFNLTSCADEVTTINAAQMDAAGNVMLVGRGRHDGLLAVRFLAGGEVDTAFSDDGVLITDLGQTGRQVLPAGVWQRPGDGRIFVGGTLAVSGVAKSVFMACLRPDGVLETAFGTGGVNVSSLAFPAPAAEAFRPLADGSLCLMGDTSTATSGGFVARYQTAASSVWSPPVVTSWPPAATTVKVGAPVTLTVGMEPGNTLVPGCQWRLGGRTAATGPVLNLAAARLQDEGSYTVLVANRAGELPPQTVALRVEAPPVIVQPPVSHAGPHGRNHDFNVTVTGRAPFTYEWRRNGGVVQTETIDRAYSWLTVPVEKVNEGEYKVTITNRDGTVTAGPVTLKAQAAPPVVVTLPTPVYMNASPDMEGTLFLLFDGSGPFTCQWQKNGKNYGAPVAATDSATTLHLPALAANSGDYRCIVKGAEGTLVTPAVPVRFYNQPAVRTDEVALISTAGGVSLQAYVFAWDGEATFQWQRNGVNLKDETSPWLIFQECTLAAAGNYRVIMRAGGHTAVSNYCSVAVVKTGGFQYAEVAAGGTVTLAAPAAGAGLRYQWYRPGTAPLASPRFTGVQGPTLQISHVNELTDLGDYVCNISRAGNFPAITTGTIRLVMQKDKPVFDPVTLSPGTVGVTYGALVNAANALVHYTARGLPPGLVFDSAEHRISGVPTTAGTWYVTFTATNPLGTATTKPCKLVIAPIPGLVAGTWCGPLRQDGGYSPCSGTITLSATGAYTLKLRGTFNAPTYASVSLTGRMTGPSVDALESDHYFLHDGMDVYVAVIWSPAGGLVVEMGGAVMEQHQNTWSARAHPATAYAGPYAVEMVFQMAFPGNPPAPAGKGYATFTPRTDGTLTFAGKLADGTAFTIPAFMDPDGGVWLEAWLYGNTGRLANSIMLSTGSAPGNLDSAVTGSLSFYRPGVAWTPVETVDNPWLAGIDTLLEVKGARHLPPGRGLLGTGPLIIDADSALPNISVSVSGGGLLAPGTVDGSLKTTQVVAFAPFVPKSEVKFTSLAFAPATGLFSGAFTRYVYDDVTGAVKSSLSIPVQGVVVRDDAPLPAGRAAGFYSFNQVLGLHNQEDPAKLVKVTVPVTGDVMVEVK